MGTRTYLNLLSCTLPLRVLKRWRLHRDHAVALLRQRVQLLDLW